ncbi:hypothetical protein SPONN_1631 [uncultured Candidatus Thioglobus sp.]|nr:hypothetical protein SPONN_1631 [uncultured Candidatus Thioglobus sp.]
MLPILILFLYPFCWFRKLLNHLPGHWYILHTFVDSFQGCYKDGTEGTRDCRWFASLFFLIRLFLIVLGAFTLTLMFFVLGSIILVMVIMIVQPFKENVRHYSTINANFLLLLTIGFVNITAIQISRLLKPELVSVSITFISVSCILGLLYIPAIFIHHIGLHRCWSYTTTPIRKLRAWRQGYKLL